MHHARQAAVARGDVREFAAELFSEPVDNVNGTVLAAGTADRNREVAAVARLVLGNAGTDEALNVTDQGGDIGVRLQEADHLRVATGEIAQRRLPVGVR